MNGLEMATGNPATGIRQPATVNRPCGQIPGARLPVAGCRLTDPDAIISLFQFTVKLSG